MLDIKKIRRQPEEIETRLKTKDPNISLASILELDEKIRFQKTQVEEIKNQRNLLSKNIGEKKCAGLDPTDLMKEVKELGNEITKIDSSLSQNETALEELLSKLPNLPESGTPVSMDSKNNRILETIGEKPQFLFEPKNHVELNEHLQLFDFKRAAKVSGSNWPAYRDLGARLEWALINYMLDIHLDNGFTFWMPPLMVRPEIALGSAHLPKFEKQLFKIDDEDHKLYLIPTAEASLMGLHYNEVLPDKELPLKYCAYTPCFRREAGGLGAQERGLIRMHQFNKVEMFVFATPDQSHELFNEMVSSARQILKGLNLHFQITELVTGDMSFAASKTYDLEVWLPGQNSYYEVSSISHCTDFQARRSNTRFKHKQNKPEFCHTLNGSGLATSRLMVALIENNQREDGSVELPLVLHKYLKGIKELR